VSPEMASNAIETARRFLARLTAFIAGG
jgi:hypothetical protein